MAPPPVLIKAQCSVDDPQPIEQRSWGGLSGSKFALGPMGSSFGGPWTHFGGPVSGDTRLFGACQVLKPNANSSEGVPKGIGSGALGQ